MLPDLEDLVLELFGGDEPWPVVAPPKVRVQSADGWQVRAPRDVALGRHGALGARRLDEQIDALVRLDDRRRAAPGPASLFLGSAGEPTLSDVRPLARPLGG